MQKLLVITKAAALSEALARAFAPAGVTTTALPAWQNFPPQEKPMYALLLLDTDTLGSPMLPELRAVLSALKGLPLVALCDMARLSNRDTADFLNAGANDVIPRNSPLPLLEAKLRAHLRRGADNDRAAASWLRR